MGGHNEWRTLTPPRKNGSRPGRETTDAGFVASDDGGQGTHLWYQRSRYAKRLHRVGPMSRNTSLTLGDHFADFVDQQVDRGRYGSASEVVRAGLRLLEEQEAQLAALRAALVEGETSGTARPLDVDAFLKVKRSARTR